MGQVAGGTSGHPICDEHTDDAICIATTLAPGCVHHNTVGCTETQDCSFTCTGCPPTTTIGNTCAITLDC